MGALVAATHEHNSPIGQPCAGHALMAMHASGQGKPGQGKQVFMGGRHVGRP